MFIIDTGYFKALMDDRDIHHKEALKINEYLKNKSETTIINTTILVETLNWPIKTKMPLKQIYEHLMDENDFIPLEHQDYIDSLEYNEWFKNAINYSDCTIYGTMKKLNNYDIISFDSNFKKIDNLTVVDGIDALKEFYRCY